MITTVVFTDGSAVDTAGGWAYTVATADGQWREQSGYCVSTTNNRMELTAVLAALHSIPPQEHVCVITDSEWVLRGATEWRVAWKARGWRNSKRKPTKHRDLWEELESILTTRAITFAKVRAHRGIPPNERCDQLASAAAAAARNAVAA
jgi:ribonuclease HI